VGHGEVMQWEVGQREQEGEDRGQVRALPTGVHQQLQLDTESWGGGEEAVATREGSGLGKTGRAG
jgi:hypothetical protein